MKIIARIYNDFKEKFGIPRQSGILSDFKSKIVFVKVIDINKSCVIYLQIIPAKEKDVNKSTLIYAEQALLQPQCILLRPLSSYRDSKRGDRNRGLQ